MRWIIWHTEQLGPRRWVCDASPSVDGRSGSRVGSCRENLCFPWELQSGWNTEREANASANHEGTCTDWSTLSQLQPSCGMLKSIIQCAAAVCVSVQSSWKCPSGESISRHHLGSNCKSGGEVRYFLQASDRFFFFFFLHSLRAAAQIIGGGQELWF